MERLKFKIAILGEPEVGKSTLNNFCSQRFKKSLEQLHESIFGVSFAVKILKDIDVEIVLVVWSFTGQDRYEALRPQYIKGVAGILLLFDLTRRETFEKLPRWITFIKDNKSDVPILLLGNKVDLLKDRQINGEEIDSFLTKYGLQGYNEISLKTGLNVEESILELAELVYKNIKTGGKVDKKINSQDFKEKPIDSAQIKLFEKFAITINEISQLIYDEISEKIEGLPKITDVTKISKILGKISAYDVKIKNLLESIPITISDSIKNNIIQDWMLKKDKLLLKIEKIKTT